MVGIGQENPLGLQIWDHWTWDHRKEFGRFGEGEGRGFVGGVGSGSPCLVRGDHRRSDASTLNTPLLETLIKSMLKDLKVRGQAERL